MKQKRPSYVFVGILVVGMLIGLFVADMAGSKNAKTEDELIRDFYLTENAVHVSPHGLRGKMDKGDDSFVVVDLRSHEEYLEEHIIGAVNIPGYKDRYTSAYEERERIVNSFRELQAANPGKDIIVYCYSIPCMTGRKIGAMLAENEIYVMHLGIGWNEWRHFWNLWNHEHEWNTTDAADYITSGPEPGTPKIMKYSKACPLGGEFGC